MINNALLFGVLEEDSVFCATDFADIDFHLFLGLLSNSSRKAKNQVFAEKLLNFEV
ncbi:hypothetical protein GCHA_4242 [Paraglaciecola chathamensis S18K6]|uniref:Uncharacterized protein n=3 Tax=Paraglaciecola chathamensis TaxID=368405 RepID=A0A8H9M5K4_9ALTE|nr:hypothetical protein GAGA_1124 [Paraglaciecola agarilytica NO2]GAC12165.1 hypothetical protein GCHA_4242 [Paraglaciecola chathamensis S18K6]GGZ72712.1 hypothetical protein GCM10011274_33770 [Paraglaciecola oceanifecundans]